MYRVWNFISAYSILLISGAVLALIWANTSPESYHGFVDWTIAEDFFIGHYHDGHRELTLHYLVNDLLMAFFFAMAGKEVWEAVILEDGSLRGKKALTPLIATAGGIAGPVAVYLGLALVMGTDTYQAVKNGWAVPIATDIAFAYLVGRLIFGANHNAVGFLLLLAIADDAAGLIILAVFYPSGELAPEWLLLSVAAGVTAFLIFNWLPRRLDRGKQSRPNSTKVDSTVGYWPYFIFGMISWYGFMRAGIHPALGLLPIIPAMPHADRAFGFFSEEEHFATDTLNRAEHDLEIPVEVVLFFFGIANAGVEFSSMGPTTWLVLLGLLIGKPVGIFIFGYLAGVTMKLGMPEGMRPVDLIVIGFVAAIGFTVSLFIAAVAFDAGPLQDAAKMGALFSFFAAVIAIISGKVLGVQKRE